MYLGQIIASDDTFDDTYWMEYTKMQQGVASQPCHRANSCSAFSWDFFSPLLVTIGLLLFSAYIPKLLTSALLPGNESVPAYVTFAPR